MGWSIGYDSHWDRDIGYGVPSICDHPDCSEKIDRGLGHVCGAEPYGGETGCGLFFCSKHQHDARQHCERCVNERDEGAFIPETPFAPTPDTDEWLQHKATDPSWAKWREEQEAN